MIRFPCPYLHGEVELTDEREQHIAAHHPDLLPQHRWRIGEALADPDEVRQDSDYPNTRIFFRWYDDLRDGKYVVVAVVSPQPPDTRHWIVTAFMARKPPKGDLEWKRP
jgi:hypothetical protein